MTWYIACKGYLNRLRSARRSVLIPLGWMQLAGLVEIRFHLSCVKTQRFLGTGERVLRYFEENLKDKSIYMYASSKYLIQIAMTIISNATENIKLYHLPLKLGLFQVYQFSALTVQDERSRKNCKSRSNWIELSYHQGNRPKSSTQNTLMAVDGT